MNMRNRLLKIFVIAENYKAVQLSGCDIVEYVGLSDNQAIRRIIKC